MKLYFIKYSHENICDLGLNKDLYNPKKKIHKRKKMSNLIKTIHFAPQKIYLRK